MFCWKCGKEHTEVVKFCEECGAYIKNEGAQEKRIVAESVFIAEDEKLIGQYGKRYIKEGEFFQKMKEVSMLLTDKRLYIKGPLSNDAVNKKGASSPIMCEKILELRDITSLEIQKATFSTKKSFVIIYAGRKIQFKVNIEEELEAERFLEQIDSARGKE